MKINQTLIRWSIDQGRSSYLKWKKSNFVWKKSLAIAGGTGIGMRNGHSTKT